MRYNRNILLYILRGTPVDIKTLQYWHKLEHFYPYEISEQNSKNIKSFLISTADHFNDMMKKLSSLGKEIRYFKVYLGLFQVNSALEALEQGMKRPMKFRDTEQGTSCFCQFTLNSNMEVKLDNFKLSSFPWAVHRVRDGKINIDHWDEDFNSFEKGAYTFLYNNKDEKMSFDLLFGMREWLAVNMNWNIDYECDWARIDVITKDSSHQETKFNANLPKNDEPIEDDDIIDTENLENQIEAEKNIDEQVKKNDLLNSFYIRDLERVIDNIKADKNSAGEALRSYLSHSATNRIDIEKDTSALLELLSPEKLPFGKWPSEYGLRLMQQMDINAFFCKDKKYQQSLFSVNGPPGTGKTTLLKDLVAAILVKRAEELCNFDMPDNAFGYVIDTIVTKNAKGKDYTNRVRNIKQELKQYGIFVASNNNGAVENVTHTLPSTAELSDKYLTDERHYFSEVSDLFFGKGKTWAMNAAALGNKKNLKKFIDIFWPIDKEYDGYNFRSELTAKTKQISLEEWETAKKSFQAKLDAVKHEYERADKAHSRLKDLLSSNTTKKALEADVKSIEESLLALDSLLIQCQNDIYAIELLIAHLQVKKNDIKQSQSFFRLKKIFFKKSEIIKTYFALEKEASEQILLLHKTRDKHFDTQQEALNKQKELRRLEEKIAQISEKIMRFEKQLEIFQIETNSPLRLDAYFQENITEEAHKSSPWGYDLLNQCRAELYLEAMALHKAFVQNSNYLRDNLDAFSKMLRGMIPEKQLPDITPALFQSFMLAVPVVSTTFASVGSFLRYLPSQEIGYLFIDEAGQAMPQSAIGAIWRARKSIVVGDPLQIEPVVTLHDSVIESLANYFSQSDVISDKYTSVQSLADMANRLGGHRNVVEGDLWIGAPLIVHNRCQKTVFDIANKIAYNEKMVFATKQFPAAVCEWIDISGSSDEGHFVQKQAEAIYEIVLNEFINFFEKYIPDQPQKYPSIFIISPFRSVKAGMANHFREHLIKHKGFKNADYQSIIRKWVNECIGTIHTFQGKEADDVLLCLGVASNGENMGAVNWACERPNILNVAVTRSKKNLYIIGDKNIWADKSFFKTAYEICQLDLRNV